MPNYLILTTGESPYTDSLDTYSYYADTRNAGLIEVGSRCLLYRSSTFEGRGARSFVGAGVVEALEEVDEVVAREDWIALRVKYKESVAAAAAKLDQKIARGTYKALPGTPARVKIPAFRARLATCIFPAPLAVDALVEGCPEFRDLYQSEKDGKTYVAMTGISTLRTRAGGRTAAEWFQFFLEKGQCDEPRVRDPCGFQEFYSPISKDRKIPNKIFERYKQHYFPKFADFSRRGVTSPPDDNRGHYTSIGRLFTPEMPNLGFSLYNSSFKKIYSRYLALGYECFLHLIVASPHFFFIIPFSRLFVDTRGNPLDRETLKQLFYEHGKHANVSRIRWNVFFDAESQRVYFQFSYGEREALGLPDRIDITPYYRNVALHLDPREATIECWNEFWDFWRTCSSPGGSQEENTPLTKPSLSPGKPIPKPGEKLAGEPSPRSPDEPHYFIFSYTETEYEDTIGTEYHLPSNNMGYYNLPGEAQRQGNIVDRIRPGDKFVLYYSGSSNNTEAALKKRFIGHGEVDEKLADDPVPRVMLRGYQEFPRKLRLDEMVPFFPTDYHKFYKRGDAYHMGFLGTIQVDARQYDIILERSGVSSPDKQDTLKDAMSVQVTEQETIISSIQTTCGYEYILLYLYYKLGDSRGNIPEESVLEGFSDFWSRHAAKRFTINDADCSQALQADPEGQEKLLRTQVLPKLIQLEILSDREHLTPDWIPIHPARAQVLLFLRARIQDHFVTRNHAAPDVFEAFFNEWSRQLVANELESLDVKPAFFTFLLDKYHGISPSQGVPSWSVTNLNTFFSRFQLPIIVKDNWDRYYNPFTGKYCRDRTINYEHTPRKYGCYYGVDDRLTCNKDNCDQIGPNKSDAHQCARTKPNVWVQDDQGEPVRLCSNYVSVIESEFLEGITIPLHWIVEYFYGDGGQTKKFIQDFHLTDEELAHFFKEDSPTIPEKSNWVDCSTYVRESSTTCSYKYVALLALLELCDEQGVAEVARVLRAFRAFFALRRLLGRPADAGSCNPLVLDRPARSTRPLAQPLDIFARDGLLDYDQDGDVVLAPAVRGALADADAREQCRAVLWDAVRDYYRARLGEPPRVTAQVRPLWERVVRALRAPHPAPGFTAEAIRAAVDPPLRGLAPAVYEQLALALNLGHHIILTGPPGTGKTTLAIQLAALAARPPLHLADVPGLVATATADWTSFDTIGGYMPAPASATPATGPDSGPDSGSGPDPASTAPSPSPSAPPAPAPAAGFTLHFHENLFLRAIRENRWLVIDEINRADIDKAFGPLFTVLSGFETTLPFHARGKPIKIRPVPAPAGSGPGPGPGPLPAEPSAVADNPFTAVTGRPLPTGFYETPAEAWYAVSPAWRIVGTMNTSDKHMLYELSYAFMRRFAFVDVGIPAKDTYDDLVAHHARGLQKLFPGDRAALHRAVVDPITRLLFTEEGGTWRLSPLQRHRKIGPAIARDVARYVALALRSRDAFDAAAYEAALCQALNLFVVPQFEGMRTADARALYHEFLEQYDADHTIEARFRGMFLGWAEDAPGAKRTKR